MKQYDCNGFMFYNLDLAIKYANFLFTITGVVHAIEEVQL